MLQKYLTTTIQLLEHKKFLYGKMCAEKEQAEVNNLRMEFSELDRQFELVFLAREDDLKEETKIVLFENLFSQSCSIQDGDLEETEKLFLKKYQDQLTKLIYKNPGLALKFYYKLEELKRELPGWQMEILSNKQNPEMEPSKRMIFVESIKRTLESPIIDKILGNFTIDRGIISLVAGPDLVERKIYCNMLFTNNSFYDGDNYKQLLEHALKLHEDKVIRDNFRTYFEYLIPIAYPSKDSNYFSPAYSSRARDILQRSEIQDLFSQVYKAALLSKRGEKFFQDLREIMKEGESCIEDPGKVSEESGENE